MIDLFIEETHPDINKNNQKNAYPQNNLNLLYTDCRKDEQTRGLSIKAKPISLILQDTRDKSHLFNFMDTPGHPNFCDEISAAFAICDGVIVVVDIVEGIQLHTEKIIKAAIKENLDIILCINKIDRIILELRLPPNDAYFKIKYTIDEFNRVISENLHYKLVNENVKVGIDLNESNKNNKNYFVSPELGNVVFSSSLYGIVFSLESYARKYYELNKSENVNAHLDKIKNFAKFLWGDIYFNSDNRKFGKKPTEKNPDRSFIEFILNPLYKIIGYTLSEEKDSLKEILGKIGIDLRLSEYKLDPKPLLKLVCRKFFGHFNSFVDIMLKKIVNAKEGSLIKVNKI
jgi:U5 small nuclear ribonucleoprotein component